MMGMDIQFEGVRRQLLGPIEAITAYNGHGPEDYDSEDADFAFDMEKDLMAYYSQLSYELDVVRAWVDNCKAIQARALENKEGER